MRANPLRGFAKQSPVAVDALAELAASALTDAAPSLKSLSAVAGVAASNASRWRAEGKGSPVLPFYELLAGLAANDRTVAGALVAYAHSILHEAVMPLDTDELVSRFWVLMGEEAKAECAENLLQQGHTLDLAALELATMREAGLQQELGAVARELSRRGVDPVRWAR